MSAPTPRVEFDKDENGRGYTLTVISDGIRFEVYLTPVEGFELAGAIERRVTEQSDERVSAVLDDPRDAP